MVYVDKKTMLKYDTEKMRLVSEKVKIVIEGILKWQKNASLYKSKKGNWLYVYKINDDEYTGQAVNEKTARADLLRYDVSAYEKEFGELEEA